MGVGQSSDNRAGRKQHGMEPALPRYIHLAPLDRIAGYQVRPGFYELYGATAIPGGVNFTVQSRGATSCELLLFHDITDEEPYAVLRFPELYRIGHVYSMIVFGLRIADFVYAYRLDGPYAPGMGLLFDKTKHLLDPYARAIAGQHQWGVRRKIGDSYRARVVYGDFDWGAFRQPLLDIRNLVIYELHVRGFTRHPSSHVRHPGTFHGLMEKIPYLKDLGVNAVELMPVFEFDEMRDPREVNGRLLLDYWGYNPVCFFAPNTGYTAAQEHNHEGDELKRLVRALNANGIEVILDVVFNHTAEGNEHGPFFSFKGFDNNVYYMLTPDGEYYNFSGCGNTLNCNHPVVQQIILDCLRYWVINYRVDGFRFDLASILGRNEDGLPMNKPPLLQSLALDPILAGVKLIAEAWDAGGMYQVGSFPAWKRWSEWNGKYRDDMRSFLKGDGGMAQAAVSRIMGSPDLYDPAVRGSGASVNFLTCHDGFTLHDLYAYGSKHNEGNGWNNTDGTDDNRSWNCGAEGVTDDPDVLALRARLIQNACAVLLCSRGTPMLLSGDEFCNTQYGNNNAYCQDNEISWLNWDDLKQRADMHAFFRYMIRFRHAHPALRGDLAPCGCGWPFMSAHGIKAWDASYSWNSRTIGVLFAGREENGMEDIVYLAVNAFWKPVEVELPVPPCGWRWKLYVDTGAQNCLPQGVDVDARLQLAPRSVAVLCAENA